MLPEAFGDFPPKGDKLLGKALANTLGWTRRRYTRAVSLKSKWGQMVHIAFGKLEGTIATDVPGTTSLPLDSSSSSTLEDSPGDWWADPTRIS